MDDKEKEGSVEMNMIRFTEHCSRDCSVKLIAHGAVGKKSYSFKAKKNRWIRLWNEFEAHIILFEHIG